jgi:hypothetical protein
VALLASALNAGSTTHAALSASALLQADRSSIDLPQHALDPQGSRVERWQFVFERTLQGLDVSTCT